MIGASRRRLKAQGQQEKLLDMPVGGHSTRNILFNRAGTKMYVSVGSQSNNNAGEDCRRAAVLEFNPDGSGYRVYASGIRNPVGLALQPGTEIVWTAVNERDNLGDDLVPDYATSLKDGGFYGWPYSYIGQNYDPRYPGAFPDLVKRTIVPDVLIPAHAAALGITFYTGMQFPQRYRNGAFVALHGSWEPVGGVGLQGRVRADEQWPARPARGFHGRPVGLQVRLPSGPLASVHWEHSISVPRNRSRPSIVVTHGRTCHGGWWRMCCWWPQESSATQWPSSSW